ncbi:hypothetical protein F4821DRAFT_27293 [Hypoxylon rubiginosum]|uniref:Uncharacterized protein n=1 Tax=Hypoxylon rubiginosum TaxID=110542 RepID=A0ACC0CM49_9PEZI|nr:hypothetical protein F4821DRAFT_27293 [Hypoxylon rubiginosum]
MGPPIPIFSATGGGSSTAGTAIAVVRVFLALAPVALPAAYLVFLKREVARYTIADGTRISPPDPLLLTKNSGDGDDDIIPGEILASLEKFVVSRERVTSHAIPIASLRPDLVTAVRTSTDPDTNKNEDVRLGGLLEAYLSATMRAFSWTPQALFIARYIGPSFGADTNDFARSFQTPYLQTCAFQPGDLVCGVYVVRSRHGSRVVLGLAPPHGWRGPVVRGVLNVGFEREGEGSVRFFNETVLWRGTDERPTVLEGGVGRWMHGLLARWLVVRGVEAVTMTGGL